MKNYNERKQHLQQLFALDANAAMNQVHDLVVNAYKEGVETGKLYLEIRTDIEDNPYLVDKENEFTTDLKASLYAKEQHLRV
jgi:hypothetical protein